MLDQHQVSMSRFSFFLQFFDFLLIKINLFSLSSCHQTLYLCCCTYCYFLCWIRIELSLLLFCHCYQVIIKHSTFVFCCHVVSHAGSALVFNIAVQFLIQFFRVLICCCLMVYLEKMRFKIHHFPISGQQLFHFVVHPIAVNYSDTHCQCCVTTQINYTIIDYIFIFWLTV